MRRSAALACVLLLTAACTSSSTSGKASTTTSTSTTAVTSTTSTVPGRSDVYAAAGLDALSDAAKAAPARVYVPNTLSGSVSVIDPATYQVVDTFKTGDTPQHVVPSADLKTLWVNNNGERTGKGSLTPIDPMTGKPGETKPVDDPYNMYFTPDGKYMIVVEEANKTLTFRDPLTLAVHDKVPVPCSGLNHIDWSPDLSYFVATCEFGGAMIKVDTATHKLLGTLTLTGKGPMPQDVRLTPDGKWFYVADMTVDGVHVLDGASFKEVAVIPTGRGTHGIYPSRDGKVMYVVNRGTNTVAGARKPPGSISVIDYTKGQYGEVVGNWAIPGGGSPDMGNVTADGKEFWVSGRYDGEVYVFDTVKGVLTRRIPVGAGPHGLSVWPQPGRFSLGHTGNMR